MESGPTLREVVWGVDSAADLDRLAPLLASAPGFTDQRNIDTTLRARDPHGLGIVFRVTQKRDPGVKGSPSNPWGAAARIDAASPVYERATPVDIGHVVLFSDRIVEAEAFYVKLGLDRKSVV